MKKSFDEEKNPKKWEKSLLRNIVTGAVILLIVITGFIIILNKDAKINELYLDKTNLSTVIETRDSVINELDGTISEIEQNISFIKNKRGQLELEQEEGNVDQKQRIIEDIALMNTMLEESEKKMEELNNQLASSNVEIKSFRNRITKLTKDIEEQNQVIVQLQSEIEERDFQLAEMDMKVTQLESDILVMNDSMNVMNDSIQKSTEKIMHMDKEMHKAYWTFGTFKELKENGVVTREGGILGILGKNKTLNSELNQEYFTELDIRSTQTIPLYAKKAEIISEHSDNSYRFVYQDDLIAFLEIEDPNEFWKLTKYAVIEVK
jgi:predicted  nucleic acid-binding Zn-ribbon protein